MCGCEAGAAVAQSLTHFAVLCMYGGYRGADVAIVERLWLRRTNPYFYAMDEDQSRLPEDIVIDPDDPDSLAAVARKRLGIAAPLGAVKELDEVTAATDKQLTVKMAKDGLAKVGSDDSSSYDSDDSDDSDDETTSDDEESDDEALAAGAGVLSGHAAGSAVAAVRGRRESVTAHLNPLKAVITIAGKLKSRHRNKLKGRYNNYADAEQFGTPTKSLTPAYVGGDAGCDMFTKGAQPTAEQVQPGGPRTASIGG